MPSEFKLVIYDDGKIIETVSKETGTRQSDLIKSLEEFQKSANAALTKLIGNRADSNNIMEMEDEEQSEDDDDDEDSIPISPKKQKK